MAVNDLVCLLDSISTNNGGSLQSLLGAVNAEPGGALSTILWSTGKLTASVPQARLGKVFGPSDAGGALVGQWIQMNAYAQADEGSPKSPAFAGLVVSAFRVAAYDAPDPGQAADQIVLLTESGRLFVFEDDREDGPQFTVQTGRRAV